MEPRRITVAKTEAKAALTELATEVSALNMKFMAVGRENPHDETALDLIFIPYPRGLTMADATELNKKVSALFAQGFQTVKLTGDAVMLGNHAIAPTDANSVDFGADPGGRRRPGSRPLR